MRTGFALLATLALCCSATSQNHVKKQVLPPDQFEIGLFTFFDFGPPFDYYTLYIVRPWSAGSKVERLILTPEGNKCFAPAKLETASATLPESVTELLGPKNPCAIPEKDIKREIKRCRKCSVFSGSKVTMQVRCGGTTRLIRADVLDRDMFDTAVHTPENTAWTMSLLEKLEKPVGPGVMDKPMFPELASPTSPKPSMSEVGTDETPEVDQGKYDALFPSGSAKLSDLYRETRKPASPQPTAKLKSQLPIMPEIFAEPEYPRLAKMTHTEGDETVSFGIDPNGLPAELQIVAGHPLLQAAVQEAVAKWRFPVAAAGQKVQATIQFVLNCPK